MRKKIIFLSVIILFSSCKSGFKTINDGFKSVVIDTLIKDKMSIRAILIDKNIVWYANDQSSIGYCDLKSSTHWSKKINDSIVKSEFRSISQNSNAVFIANIGNPAFFYKLNKSDLEHHKVYEENNTKAFYDSMLFWNEKEGIAIGDPTEDCLSIVLTRDSGNSWKKTDCSLLPKVVDGEAAFAASNTNICINKNRTWIVSGGKKARLFYSEDKGKSWVVYETPIVQGLAMTGIFSADFYNEKIGAIAGGNYELPKQDSNAIAITFDSGKTWKIISENSGIGYVSCVQFVPNSNGKQIVTVGPSGLFHSVDSGETWKRLSSDNALYTLRFIDKNTAIAAGKNKIIRIKFY